MASPADAPDTLTFGPPFMALASQLPGQVTLSLNRQLDNQSASLAAAVLAKQQMPNLFAIELGNEPECERCIVFPRSSGLNVLQSTPVTRPSSLTAGKGGTRTWTLSARSRGSRPSRAP